MAAVEAGLGRMAIIGERLCHIIFLVLLYLPQEAEVTFVLVVSFLFGRLLVCDG